jgi:hypothetical protein
MPATHNRYSKIDDVVLFELANQNQSGFRADAWEELQNEIKSRESSGIAPIGKENHFGEELPERSSSEIGGWLALFQVAAFLGFLFSLMAVPFAISEGDTRTLELAVARTIFLGSGLFLMSRRHPGTRRYWIAVLIAAPLVSVLIAPEYIGVLGAAGSWAWAVYWHRSKRVHATFRQV